MSAKTYCDDAMMAYPASRKKFQSGERIVFDESYRLAHLPLVNPDHPAVISQADGRDYVNGRYEKVRHALVIPIAGRGPSPVRIVPGARPRHAIGTLRA